MIQHIHPSYGDIDKRQYCMICTSLVQSGVVTRGQDGLLYQEDMHIFVIWSVVAET